MSPAKPSLLISSSTSLVSLVLAALGLAACGAEPAANATNTATASPTSAGAGLVILDNGIVGPNLEGLPVRPYYHSFGNVPEGETVSHAFQIENRDPQPVTIQKIVPGCGCTVPTVSYIDTDGNVVRGRSKPGPAESVITIPAGVTFDLQVQIDTHDVRLKNAEKTSTIVVTTDSPNSRYVKLEAHIFVERPFNQVPTGVNFGRVALNGGGTGSMELVPASGYDFAVTEALSLPDQITAEIVPLFPSGIATWAFRPTLHPPLELGFWTGEAILSSVNGRGEPGPTITVRMQAEVVADILPHPARFVFRNNDPTSFSDVLLTSLLPGHQFRITGAEPTKPEHRDLLDFTFEAVDPGLSGSSAKWNVHMSLAKPSDDSGLLRGDVLLSTDDPEHPEIRLGYVVHAQ